VLGTPDNVDGFIQLGVEACSTPPTSCVGGRFAYSNEDGNYQLLLTPGTSSIRGIVQYYSFSNGSIQYGTSHGAPQEVTVQAGVDTSEDFTVTISP
jgi:hypothetical protein